MNTFTMTSETVLRCDKCGRDILPGKTYLDVSGWKICGICQWEESMKKPVTYPIQEPETKNPDPIRVWPHCYPTPIPYRHIEPNPNPYTIFFDFGV